MSEALYDRIGVGYARQRRSDPRIAARIHAALGSTRTVLNVGAGSGSYEPADRRVVAVEPSVEMIGQRLPTSAAVVRARAEQLPFADRSFEASLASLTIHHWRDWRAGLREMRRVTSGRIVIFTWDPEHDGFWLVRDYFPEILTIDRPSFPSVSDIESAIGPVQVHPIPIPADCADGFLGAFWRRPEAYLDPAVRRAMSIFAKMENVESRLVALEEDLGTGRWARRNSALSTLAESDLGYRIIVTG